MASSAKSSMIDSICLAKQADLEAVAFSGTGRRLARAAIGLGSKSHHARPTLGPVEKLVRPETAKSLTSPLLSLNNESS